MEDLLFVLGILIFFLATGGLLVLCQRLMES